ncbi:MAG: hypothetical protein ABJN42_04850 [Roseibium sp.]|uniref:hypothetical protein n=1 Tax=Roseibium sp. TaxID=1936156 RepID=UPI003298A994
MTTTEKPTPQELLQEAASNYRAEERVRFREGTVDGYSAIEREVRADFAADPEYRDAANQVLNDIFLELHHRRIEGGLPVKQFEAHHEDQVCREALLIMLAETKDPRLSGDFVRRRMCLTATAEEFFLNKPEEPTMPTL